MVECGSPFTRVNLILFFPGTIMAFPTKADRQKCYDSRDQYWNCLLVNEENQQKCLKQRKLFESDCPAQWVSQLLLLLCVLLFFVFTRFSDAVVIKIIDDVVS